MVSIRRHSSRKGLLDPAEEELPLHPVGGEMLGSVDEPGFFLRGIDLNQPPPQPRGRGRPRGSGRGRGRGRGRGGGRGRGRGGQVHGHHQGGRGRRGRRVPRGRLLRSNLPPDTKSIILALATPACDDSDKAALATCNDSNKIRNGTVFHLNKKGQQESCVYLRESCVHEITPFAIPVGINDGMCEEVPCIDLGDDNTTNVMRKDPQEEDQSNPNAEETDILWERDGKMAKAKGRGMNKFSEHMASPGKRKSTNVCTEENNSKKARMVMSKSNNSWEWDSAAGREMVGQIGSGIISRVEAFKKGLGDVFVMPSFDPPLDKYDGLPGVILRASDIADLSEQDFFTYVQQDMKILQGFANAETLDKTALSSQINKILAHWTKLFSNHISGGMADMIQALNELKGLVASDAVSPLPFDAAGATDLNARIEEALKEAAALQQAILGALKEIGQVVAAAHVRRNDLIVLKEKQKKKIARLKASLALAEKSLEETENQETKLEQFLKESEAACQDSSKYSDYLKKTTDYGELVKAEVHKCMLYAGVGSKSVQPKPVRSLISYILSSSSEGA